MAIDTALTAKSVVIGSSRPIKSTMTDPTVTTTSDEVPELPQVTYPINSHRLTPLFYTKLNFR